MPVGPGGCRSPHPPNIPRAVAIGGESETVTYLDLRPELCTGPACPQCGCQDAEILREPDKRPEGERSWWGSGWARCRNCHANFHFQYVEHPEPVVNHQPAPVFHQEPVVEVPSLPAPVYQEPVTTHQEPLSKPRQPPVDWETVLKPLCPGCGSNEVRVTHTYKLFRRYQCKKCDGRFKRERERETDR